MYIIDKNKDFYDYYSHIYGVDKAITFDRRGSIILNDDYFISLLDASSTFSWSNPSSSYFLLEVGYKQYMIKYSNVKKEYDRNLLFDKVVSYDISLGRVFEENKHLFRKEVSIVKAYIPSWYDFGLKYNSKKNILDLIKLNDVKFSLEKVIELPILSGTQLTSLLDANELWKEISTYISSQGNDKDIDIINTDKDKIINHGFDTKTSFRHPIK